MPITVLKDWNDNEVSAVRSKGGVFAFPDFADNLLRLDRGAWPPPEVVQKLFKSEKLWAFPEEDQQILTSKLGYYCDLQSVHSEDAMQWSYFGPLVYGTEEQRVDFARWLRSELALNCPEPTRCSLAMWRRLPHPENGTPNGPELDLLVSTDSFTFLVESKWRSGEGRWQGLEGNATQVQLRQRFLARFGRALFGDSVSGVIYVILDDSQRCTGDSRIQVPVTNLRWADLLRFQSHPRTAEVRRYYDWKRNLVARKFGIPAPG